MKNYIGPGNTLTLVAPAGGVTSGVPVIIGSQFVIPKVTAPEGSTFAAERKGIFSLAKKAEDTPAQCAKAYWSSANSELTTTASGNKLVGVFESAGVADQTEINVLLTGEIV